MTKAELRRLFLEKRKELSEEETGRFTKLIADQLLPLLIQKEPAYLHVFLPMAGKNEVNTWHLIDRVQYEMPATKIVIPRVVTGTTTLEHYEYSSRTELITSSWRIPEPNPQWAVPVAEDQLDIVLVPLLSFDARGYRVGYGGGYYDRFLAQCKPDVVRMGLSFFEQGPLIDDSNEYDVKLDYVVTPTTLQIF